VAGGQLLKDGDPYPVLRLSAAGAALLRGEASCELFREIPPPARERRRGRRSPPRAEGSALFDVQRGVPPYVIFHDQTLHEMAARRPTTLAELHDIYGVGARKSADFGDRFLAAIRAFPTT
jgi:ATP-dependent DNA helicase RecQ